MPFRCIARQAHLNALIQFLSKDSKDRHKLWMQPAFRYVFVFLLLFFYSVFPSGVQDNICDSSFFMTITRKKLLVPNHQGNFMTEWKFKSESFCSKKKHLTHYIITLHFKKLFLQIENMCLDFFPHSNCIQAYFMWE